MAICKKKKEILHTAFYAMTMKITSMFAMEVKLDPLGGSYGHSFYE